MTADFLLLQIIFFTLPLLISGCIHHFVIIRFNIFKEIACPVDFNLKIKNTRLFGDSKTWRGFIVMMILTASVMWLEARFIKINLNYNAFISGVILGFGYSFFELPNSFLKRQMGIKAGRRIMTNNGIFKIIDHIDSVIGSIICLFIIYNPSYDLVLMLFIIACFSHVFVDFLLHTYSYKKELISFNSNISNNIIILSHAVSGDLSNHGGKAFNLLKLIKYKYNIPEAFVITPKDLNNIEKIKKDVLFLFDDLSSKYVAVRSSGILEDSKDKSFAGQFKTLLGVKRADLICSINKCMESQYSDLLKTYTKRENKQGGEMAVIVQKMIDADFSGVCFTQNPVNRNQNEVIIEAIEGIGSLLVDAKVTPSQFILEKNKKEIKQKFIVKQEMKLVINKERGGLKDLKINDKNRKSISDDKIIKICELANDIEKIFNTCVDIEWEIMHNKIYILQVRPITYCVK